MRSQIIVCLWFFFWVPILVRSEKSFSVEKIAQNGINFRDIIDEVRLYYNNEISTGCIEQIRELWANNRSALWQMAEAWSIFPYSGAIYYSSKSDWGNYDECIKVDVTHKNDHIVGKFCASGWVLPDPRANETTPYYSLSYCVPEKCTAADLNSIVKIELFNELCCSSKNTDSELDTGAYVVIVIFLVIFACMVFSTAYDLYLYSAQKKSASPLFTAFSVYNNGKKLLHFTRNTHASEQILCFHGMKFISMWWIISGHGAGGWSLLPVVNRYNFETWQSSRISQYMTVAPISVDTFFYISGFLMAYLYFKQEISKKPIIQQVANVPAMILHRYLRLTPASAMCFLGSAYLFKYLQDGPYFSYMTRNLFIKPCKKYWWTYFLYIQNYYNVHFGDSLCIPITWYLSADMQLFLVTPLIIIPLSIMYRKSFKKTMAILVALNMLFLAIPIFTKLYWRDYDPNFQEYDFHSKLISYFIGVMMGIYMRHEKQKKVVISTVTNLCLWSLSLGTMLAVMFYRGEIEMRSEYVSKSLCYSFTRPMWCLALSWITFACVSGYGGVVNWFLSSSFMQFGGKLTYCLYIVHGMIIAHFTFGIRNKSYFSDWYMFYQNCGYFIVSMLIAIFWSLSYESPMITIERMIFGGGKPKPKVESTQHTIE